MKKILIFSTAYYPMVGGAEVAIKEITDRISDVQFDLITGRFSKRLLKVEKVGNVTVYRVGVGIGILDKLLLPFWGAIKAAWLNGKNGYSAYWCMMASFGSGAAYIANIFSSKKAPIILTLQEGDSESHLKYRWFGLIDLSWRMALKRASHLTVISNYLGERARRLGYRGEIELIPNGVSVESYSQIFSEEELADLRAKINGSENVVALVSTSRLNKKNGLDLVIRSLKFLPDNFHFYNFGSGSERDKLQKLAGSLGLNQRVHLGEYVDHDELPKYLKVCDIFIRPSRSEGQGISFLEAMAAKIPVIATPVGGIVDFLHNGETGYFCEPENPQSIAEAVERVLSDPNKNQIIENAYNMVVQKYDWGKIALQMEEVFDSVSNNQ